MPSRTLLSRSPASLIESALCLWSRQVLKYPLLVLVCFVLLSAFSMLYTAENLGINTNTSEMLSSELPFQKNRKRLEQEFPQDAGVLIMVVEAPTPEETSIAASLLKQKLSQLKSNFKSVYIPTDNHFFRQQALLFLDIDELDELAEKLTNAQPFLGYLGQNFHLQGLFDIISQALSRQRDDLPMQLEPLLEQINQHVEQQLGGQHSSLSWQRLLASDKFKSETNRTIVLAKPIMNFDEILPAGSAIAVARDAIKHITAQYPSVSIRVTGEPALEHEEMESVTDGSIIAGIVSLILVCLSLISGLRSFKLLIATFLALILGLILTAGFATLSIGHLNLISIAFAVLYIGLGVDFAIHFCLQYRESMLQGLNQLDSLNHTIKTIGLSLFLCALTTSLGFLAFIPTDYSGVSEFGVISGGGMFIGLFVTITFLPAFLKVFASINIKPHSASSVPGCLVKIPAHHAWAIRLWAVILALIASLLIPKTVFDSNPVNMRNPASESVKTIRQLLLSHHDSPFALAALAENLPTAIQKAEAFAQLPSVHSAITLHDIVAPNQAEKIEIIEDLAFVLGNQLENYPQQVQNSQPQKAISTFILDTEKYLQQTPSANPPAILQKLLDNLDLLLAHQHADAASQQLQTSLLNLLPHTLQQLKSSLSATPYELADIPYEVSSQWIGQSGVYKVLITPEFDQNIPQNLHQFVTEVQTIDPAASGLPVADLASGVAVVDAFIEAFSGAIIAIFILLLLILKSLKHTLLVMGPLILASLLTGASSVIFNNPINFANIIALPLLMGMGVDSGIHILHRLKNAHSTPADILQSSTARGVFFSSLTTLFSFSSLAFVPHQGTASMGLLLAIGISFTLLCTLLVLPAFYGSRHLS